MIAPVQLSVLSILFALAVSIRAWIEVDFSWDTRTALFSAAIEWGMRLVFFGGLVGLLLIGIVRRRLLVVLLVMEAAILAAAIGLVAIDGATYKARFTCSFLCFDPRSDNYTSTHDLSYLYLWALPLAVLLLQALRTERRERLLTSKKMPAAT